MFFSRFFSIESPFLYFVLKRGMQGRADGAQFRAAGTETGGGAAVGVSGAQPLTFRAAGAEICTDMAQKINEIYQLQSHSFHFA
ncbi:MAG: hypothetical protein IJ416_07800 [Ruminiclostridium sp.]|nr:hypothetical protein [Ruminiclostridium sp.]